MTVEFKLQAVLKYRKTLEEQAQQRLAELLGAEAKILQQLTDGRAQFDALSAQLQEKQRTGVPVLEMQLYQEQIFHHQRRSEQLQQQLNELKGLLDQRRRELLVAAREAKIIEKLKEKQLAEYLRNLERKERLMLDEISLRQKGGPE